ncbi:hypothetical protein SB748_34555, partial [Rhizobium sp. SIMBA_035]
KINNTTFKSWIKKETEGYDENDELPDYRTIPTPCFLVAEFPFGETQHVEILIPDKYGDEIQQKTYFHRVSGPINTIIENIESIE